jgi:hypothetical protein
MAAAGLSRRTVQHWCRWLENHGLLAVLEPGTTPRFRPAILLRGDGNLAREWRLSGVPVERSCTPPLPVDLDRSSPTRARERETNKMDQRSALGSLSASPPPPATSWPPDQKPATRRESLAAAEALRRELPVLRRMSARAVRAACRIYCQAGWTPADLVYALDHDPDCVQYPHTAPVRSVAGWARARWDRWLNAQGVPLASASQLRAEADRIRIADQATLAAQAAAEHGRRVDADGPDGPGARARALLAASSPSAAKIIAIQRARGTRRTY